MKIKATMNFVSGRYSANRGEVITVPDAVGAKLVDIALAEEAPESPSEAPKAKAEEVPTDAAKTSGRAKARPSARRK